VKFRVVLIEMQFTSNIVALVLQSVLPHEASAAKGSEKSEDSGSRAAPKTPAMTNQQQYSKQQKAAKRRSQRELIIWDTKREEAVIQVQFLQKIIGIQLNLKHIAIMSKDKVFLYDLAGMIFVHRLNLEHHLGRVQLVANISGERPLLFYSNSAD